MPNRCLVGICRMDVCIDGCRSLKEKRRIVRSLKERLRNQYHVAVCEYGELGLWQRAEIAVTSCGNARDIVTAVLRTAADFVRVQGGVTVLHEEIRIFDTA